MDHIKVQSSNIESVAHKGTVLHVRFKNGGLYEFMDVSKDQFNALVNAESPGKHFNSMGIKGSGRKIE
jgi:hypothetical protein